MLFGFIFFLFLVLLFVCGFFFLFFEKTRIVGWSSLGGLFGLVGFLALVDSFQPKPMVKEAPLESEIIGTWECTKLSAGFKKEAPLKGPPPRLVISKMGISAVKLPMDDPYRYEYLTSAWELCEPEATPSGCYSVTANGQVWFICYKDGDELILRQTIDVIYNYEAEYRRLDAGE